MFIINTELNLGNFAIKVNTLGNLPYAVISVKYNLNPLMMQFYAEIVKATLENDILQLYSEYRLILCLHSLITYIVYIY